MRDGFFCLSISIDVASMEIYEMYYDDDNDEQVQLIYYRQMHVFF